GSRGAPPPEQVPPHRPGPGRLRAEDRLPQATAQAVRPAPHRGGPRPAGPRTAQSRGFPLSLKLGSRMADCPDRSSTRRSESVTTQTVWTPDAPGEAPRAFAPIDGPAGGAPGRRAERAAGPRERLAAIVESSDEIILSYDLDGTITSWNGGAERALGYSADEIIGQHVSVLIPPDHGEVLGTIHGRILGGSRHG